MSDPGTVSIEVKCWLDRLRNGDQAARESLLHQASGRLKRLARRMLRGFPEVGRWEQTDDVLQNALIRLNRALSSMTPDSARHFFNLAALEIRRELLDLARHYCGPHGQGAKHDSVGRGTDPAERFDNLADSRKDSTEPETMEQWATFHEQVDLLPDEEREVFNLLWYEELSQAEAASVLEISERTVARRWTASRVKLGRSLMR